MPTVELISPTDTILFAGTPDVTGFVYNNTTLDKWFDFAGAEAKVNKRPNAHGAYSLGTIYAGEHMPIVNGKFYGATPAAAGAARRRLRGMFAEGKSVSMRVTEDDGTFSTREVWLVELSAPWQYDFTYFPFDLSLVAPDPRRYGPTTSSSDGMPSAGSGLVWNLGTAASGLYFDWGTPGTAGQVVFTNTGTANTLPRLEVGGPGSIAGGFRITEVETGRELVLMRDIAQGETVSLDSRTARATVAGGDVTGLMSRRQWFEIPAGATRRYQITPLGSVSGAPTLTIYAASADL